LLKRKNHRMTRQRAVILEVLKKVKTHPGADEIFEMARKRLPRISLGTVYRNLEVLSELREIQKFEHIGTLKRFDGTPESHYHVRCVKCGRLDDVPFEIEANLEKKVTPHTNYSIIGHRLEFIGFCPECAKSPLNKMLIKQNYNPQFERISNGKQKTGRSRSFVPRMRTCV